MALKECQCMLPTAVQVRKADEYMAKASKELSPEGQFLAYGRAWKLLRQLEEPEYCARQRDCLAKLIAACYKITVWDDAERDAAITKYKTALGKLPPLLSAEEKALLTKVRRLMEKGLTSHHVDSRFFAYQQAWKQLKKQKSPGLIPTMRDCLAKLIVACHQMTNWRDEERNATIQKYQAILVGLSEAAPTPSPLANTAVKEISSVAVPATSLPPIATTSQPVVAGPTSSSAMPELTPKIAALFSVVPFANTEKLVLAYQLQKHRCLQHPKDESAKQHLHDIEDIIQDNIIANEMALSESSLKQGIILLGAGLSDKTMQLLIKQLFKLIADNPLDFLAGSAATELGMVKAGDKLTDAQLRKITSSLVQQMQGLHAPDIAMMCLVLNTLYQALATMMSKQVSHMSQALHLAPIKAVLYNLKHRLQAVETKLHNALDQLQWTDIHATIEYALDSLARFTTEEMPWQQRARYARITGTLLLQAAGIGGAVIGAVSDPDASIGSAINAAVGLLQHLWRHDGTIYRYCHCNQPYFTALKKWQVHFIDEVLPQYPLWDNALMSLRLPIEDNDKSRLWLKNSNAQVGVMRTLMAVYDMPTQGIEMPATKATLQKKTVQLLINYYQQSINQPEASHQLVRLTAAQYLLSLQPQLSTLQTELINTLITLADRKLLKMSEVTQTIADEPRVITIDSPTNIALQGWRQRYPDDEALYRLLRSYPTLPAEEKGGFLQCMQEFVKDGSTKQLSYWGREVIAALGEELTSAIRRLPTCSDPACPAKLTFAGIMAAARGKIIAHKGDIDEAKRVKMAMLREHLGLLSDMATEHRLFEQWESQMDKWHIGELIAAGVIEATVAPIISPHEVDVEILSGQAETAVLAASTMETQPLVVHRSDTVSRGAGAAAAAPNPFASYSQVDNSTIFIFGHLSVDPQFPIDTLLDKLAALLRSSRQGLSLELMQLAERFNASGTSEQALYCYAAAYCVHLQDQSPCPPTLVPCIERLLNTLADTGFATDAGLRCMQKPNNVEGEAWLHYFIVTYPAPHLIDYLLDQEQHRWQLQARYRGKTPLMLAIQSRDDALCGQLLAHGATTAGCDGAGNTCLHLACQQGFSKVIARLLETAKPVTEVVGPLNAAGDTVLHALCASGCHEWSCYEDILRCFPSAVNQRNLAGYFPLQLAACYTPLGIFTELQAKTTAVLSAGEDGKTCLHLAAEFGNAAIVQRLAPQGEVNALDGMQSTPLQLAARGRQLGQGRSADDYRQVFIALLQHGADETVRNCQGQTVRDAVSDCQAMQEVFEQAWAQVPQCLLQRWQAECVTYYTQPSFVNKRLFDTDYFSLADYFVNLQVVVKTDETNEVTQSNDDKRSHKPLRARDRLAGKKEAIAQNDLFQPSAYQDANGKSPPSIDTVVVSGAAGVGKTTLVDYIAYQWGLFKQGAGKEGLWSGFETVLIVQCRELLPGNLMPDNQYWGIAHLVYRACWKDLSLPESGARELLSKLQEKPNKCLLLLDGLDELPVPETDYWRSLLGQLFRLPFKKLVTTRPYAIGNLQQWLSHDGLVEIQGFSDEDVPTFFKKHLGATERTTNFIKDIKQNPDLWAIVHIPINAYLLKIWWETTCQQDKPVLLGEMSVSNLYESLMVNVCRRYLAKIGELDENKLLDDELVLEVPSIRCLLDTLGCWAFEGLRQDSAQLPISWLKGIQGSDESPTLLSANRLKQLNVPALKALGLLKQVGRAIRAHQRYEFLHLSFQEFLAANVMAVTLREGAEEKRAHLTQVIHRYKYHPNFTLVWPSVAGLLSRYPTALNDFLSILVAGPKDWVGIVEFGLLMRCLESSLPFSTDTKALGLQQQTLLWAAKQCIKRFNELPQEWQWTIIDTLSVYPKLIRLNADTVLALFQDETVNDSVRGKLASSAVSHLSQTPGFMDTVWAFLRDETVSDYVREKLASSAVAHLSPTPELVDAVWALLRDKTVSDYVRGALASSAVSHLSPTPECVDAVWALFQDETVSNYVRGKLAESVIARLSPTPECVDAVWAFLRDEKVRDSIRGKLAESVIAHLSPTPECVDAVCLFLRDEKVSGSVRGKLASSAVSHFSQITEFVGEVLAFLQNEKLSEYVRVKLAIRAVSHFSQIPEFVDAVWVFLRDETINKYVRGKLAIRAVAHFSQIPECVDAVWAFLRDEMVRDSIRGKLAESAVSHLSPTPECVDAVWAFLRDEKVSGSVRGELASSAVAHLPQTPEFVDAVWVFLRDETINKYVRGELAISAVTHLSPTPECVDAVWAFLRDEKVSGSVRGKLASSAVSHLSPTPGFMDTVWAFLRDETVNDYVRVDLAISAVEHLSQTPELVDAVLVFFRDETVSDSARIALANSAVAHLSPTPELVDTVWAFLRDKTVHEYVRGKLARNAAAHFSSTPELVDVVWAFLRDKAVYARAELASSAVAHLSRIPKFVNAVRRFLRDETVDYYVRGKLAISAVAHLSQTPELVYAVLAFLRDEKVSKSVRRELAGRAFAHLLQTPELVDVVWAFLRDETVSNSVRVDLASSAVEYLSPTPGFVGAVWAFLRDETVDYYVRRKLASSAAEYLSPTPGFVDVVLAFLRDKTVSDYVRGELARSAIQLLPKWPNKIQAFLDSLFVKDSDWDDLSQRADISVHLLLPLYKKAHDKGRQYIRKQLVKHRVLVYEQAGTVLVAQAGQTEKLILPPPLIQQIQKDLQAYRININDSVSTLSKLNLFSKSAMSSFSSQHTENRSNQTSHSNMGRVMQ